MLRYVVWRLLAAAPVLVGVSIVVFLSLHAIPGDPAVLLAGDDATAGTVEALRERFKLDHPLWEQYVAYVGRMLQGDLGTSWRTGRPVLREVGERYPYTIRLALFAMTVATIGGVAAGVISAARRDSLFDTGTMIVAMVGVSAPAFWIGLVLQWLFGVRLGWLPTAGVGSWRHLVLPGLTLALFSAGNIARLTRASMVDVLGLDYIRTAYAKGNTANRVLFHHALKASLIPVITVIGLQLGFMLAGAVITETVFAYPGMGLLLIQAIVSRDYAIVQGITLAVAVTYVVVNIGVDALYVYLDPRIAYG